MNPALLSSDKMDWCTPTAFFNALDNRFNFTLDAAATEANSKCVEWFDESCDTFQQCWHVDVGSVWLNPPYGRGLFKWVTKACREAAIGSKVVMLVPARPDTRWFAAAYEQATEVWFVRGRLRFGGAPAPAPFPSVVFVLESAGNGNPKVGFLNNKGAFLDYSTAT